MHHAVHGEVVEHHHFVSDVMAVWEVVMQVVDRRSKGSNGNSFLLCGNWRHRELMRLVEVRKVELLRVEVLVSGDDWEEEGLV